VEALLNSLGLGVTGFVVVAVMVFLGAVVQGSIGFGLNLIAVPAIAAFRPDVLPAAGILLALPMTLGSAVREREHIDPSAVLWTTLGRLPGVGVGAWVVSVLTPGALSVVIGGIVLFAVALSLWAPGIPINRASLASAGLLGGLMGTASSVGGPPIALLYQRVPGPKMRSTLGATFMVGTALSLMALAFFGEVRAVHGRFGLAMVVPVLLGLFASRALHGWVDRGWLRPCVLAFAGLAGLGVVAHGLVGF
jgi:hypothetical protein